MPVGTGRRGLIRPASTGGEGGGLETRRVRRRLRFAMSAVCHACRVVQSAGDDAPAVDFAADPVGLVSDFLDSDEVEEDSELLGLSELEEGLESEEDEPSAPDLAVDGALDDEPEPPLRLSVL